MVDPTKAKQNMKKYKYRIGFTLAEVLITLVIIGIIAAVTVPAIIQQTQKQEYVISLKKAYSTLQNALYKMADNNGYPHGDYTFLNNVNFIDEFAKVANVEKKCDTSVDCMPLALNSSLGEVVYKRLNGTIPNWVDGKTAITSDGIIYTAIHSSNLDGYGLTDEDKEKLIVRVLVDVNGWKKPNQFGRDFFVFYLHSEKGLLPAGGHDSSDCNKNGTGYSCAAKVLKENKIDY